MLRTLAYVGLLLVVAAALLGGATWLALEGQEVAVLHTTGSGRPVRMTRVWVADADGFIWIEAATPERPFYIDLLDNPVVELERAGKRTALEAEPLPGPAGHAKIRRLLRERYGWADVWISVLQDTSESVAVRLKPVAGTTHR